MPEFVVPTYIFERPSVERYFDVNTAVRRWLVDLGEDGGGTFAAAIDRLVARLGTSHDCIQAIFDEARFKSLLDDDLIDLFAPVPHETEAREQFVRLASTTWELPRLPGHGRRWVTPRQVQFWLDTCRPPLPDALAAEWRAWAATWAAVVTRNPLLELREWMRDVFESHSFNGWQIGSERRMYDWVKRGRRNPMPFSDLHASSPMSTTIGCVN